MQRSKLVERSPTSSDRPLFNNIYDNMQLVYSKEYEFLNRSLAKSISKNLDGTGVCKEEQKHHLHQQQHQRKIIDSSPPTLTPHHQNQRQHYLPRPVEPDECDVPLFSLPSLSSGYSVDLLPNIDKITQPVTTSSTTTTKGKRGRKRKVTTNAATSSMNIIVPGNHTKAGKQRKNNTTTKQPALALKWSNPTFEKDVDLHFKSSLDKFYTNVSPVVNNQQQQKQSVITANPVNLQQQHITYPQFSTIHPLPSTSNYQARTTANTFPQSMALAHVVVPPAVPSHIATSVSSTSTSRPSSLDILKQAAVAGLPPESKVKHAPTPYYPLSSQQNLSGVVAAGVSTGKMFLPHAFVTTSNQHSSRKSSSLYMVIISSKTLHSNKSQNVKFPEVFLVRFPATYHHHLLSCIQRA